MQNGGFGDHLAAMHFPIGSDGGSPPSTPRKTVEGPKDGGYLIRTLPVERTGDILNDDELQSQMDSLASMTHQLIQTPRHVGPLASNSSKRNQTDAEQWHDEQDSKFKVQSLHFKTIPPEWVVVWLTIVSDLLHEDLA